MTIKITHKWDTPINSNNMYHTLQLSLNLWDSPGFLAIVLRTGRLYYNCIIGPGRGIVVIKFNHIGCGVGGVLINDGYI